VARLLVPLPARRLPTAALHPLTPALYRLLSAAPQLAWELALTVQPIHRPALMPAPRLAPTILVPNLFLRLPKLAPALVWRGWTWVVLPLVLLMLGWQEWIWVVHPPLDLRMLVWQEWTWAVARRRKCPSAST